MGITGLTSLTDNGVQSGSVQQQGQQGAGYGAFRAHHHERDHGGGDRFTSSNGQGQGSSAQDAGLFTVQQVEMFSAAAVFVLAQPSSSSSGAGTSSNAAGATDPQTGSASADAAAPASSSTAAGGSGDANGPAALQGLNSALATLGMNQQEIQAFDQVASLIQTLSPAAFSALVSQFQVLAQDLTQAGGTASNVQDQGTNGNGSAAAAPAGNSTPSGGVQVEDVVVRFSEVSVQESSSSGQNGQQASTANTGSQGQASNSGSGGTIAFQAYSLQIDEFTATLQANSGQATQAQTPSQTAAAS